MHPLICSFLLICNSSAKTFYFSEKFKSINGALVDILKTLGTVMDELRREDPVETVDMANNMSDDDIINDVT